MSVAATPPQRHVYFVAVELADLERVHITLTWLGKKEKEQLGSIWAKVLMAIGAEYLPFYFPDPARWVTLGKPEDIEAGRGVKASLCDPCNQPTAERLTKMHQELYFPEPGEAPERKERQKWHVTAKSKEDEEKIGSLAGSIVQCKSVFIKQVGGPRVLELVFRRSPDPFRPFAEVDDFIGEEEAYKPGVKHIHVSYTFTQEGAGSASFGDATVHSRRIVSMRQIQELREKVARFYLPLGARPQGNAVVLLNVQFF